MRRDQHDLGARRRWRLVARIAQLVDKVITHTNLYWQLHEAPGRTAGVVTTDEVRFENLQPTG